MCCSITNARLLHSNGSRSLRSCAVWKHRRTAAVTSVTPRPCIHYHKASHYALTYVFTAKTFEMNPRVAYVLSPCIIPFHHNRNQPFMQISCSLTWARHWGRESNLFKFIYFSSHILCLFLNFLGGVGIPVTPHKHDYYSDQNKARSHCTVRVHVIIYLSPPCIGWTCLVPSLTDAQHPSPLKTPNMEIWPLIHRMTLPSTKKRHHPPQMNAESKHRCIHL